MPDFVSKVMDKLEEYDISIFDNYLTEGEEHLISVDNMIIMVDIKKNELSISFHAASRPDDVANAILILNEIPELNYIHIMESFILVDGKEKKVVQGDEAYELLKKGIEREAVKKYALESIYKDLLLKCEDCHEC